MLGGGGSFWGWQDRIIKLNNSKSMVSFFTGDIIEFTEDLKIDNNIGVLAGNAPFENHFY